MLKLASSSGSQVINTFYKEIDEDGNVLRDGFKGLGGVFCYESEVIKGLGGFEPWACSADSDLFYRSQKYGANNVMVKEHLYLYRQHPRQLTRSPATKFGSVRREMYEKKWHDERVVVKHPVPPHRGLKP